MGRRATPPRLMLVTDRRRTRGRDLVRLVAQAVAGGVGIVQLRERDLPDVELRELVQHLRRVVPPSIPLLVNGSLRVARTAGCGLHLAAAEPSPGRTALERIPLFGRSAHDLGEASRARREGADYVILGTIFPTPSKPGHPGSGVALVREIAEALRPLPLYAIGGISVSRVPGVIRAGAHGVAVCGAILGANEPRRVAEALALALSVSRPA